MAIYRYLALGANGAEVSGNVTAADAGVARKSLQGQGLRVLELESGENGNIASGGAGFLKSLVYTFRLGLSVRTGDLQMYYRQMQLMLRAGHTLIEALEASSRLAARPRLGKILERCAEKISAGSTFSAAMAAESKIFSRLTVKLTEAGEATGELDAVFERLAVLAERRADVRRQMVAALTYPAIVTLAAIGVVSFLVVTVIPRFAIFLESRGKAIPWAAQTMMDTADWLTRWGFLLVVGIIATIAGVLVARHLLRPFKLITDRLFLGVPVIGGTLMSAAMAQASWTFGLLLKSRLTVLDNMLLGAPVQPGEGMFRALFPGMWRKQEQANIEKAEALLERFLLIKKKDDYAGALSGGQRKLLEMARALMSDPKLVMLDEPMAGVNPALKQSLLDHIMALREEGTTVLFVEHDINMVRHIADWVTVMAEGKIVAEGQPKSVMNDPAVIDAYLGAHANVDLGDDSVLEDLKEA